MKRLLAVLFVAGVVFPVSMPAAVAEDLTADDYLGLWKPLVGAWESVATVDGKADKGTWSCKLSRTKKCLVTYGEGGLLPANEAIHGYDPGAKQWKVTTYDAAGGYWVEILNVKDMKKGKQLGTDYVCSSEMKRYSADGTATTSSSMVRITAYEKDRIEAVVTDRKENGQSQPDIKFVMERQQKKVSAKK